MMLRIVIFGTLFVLLFVPLASAVPTFCSGGGGNTDGLLRSDMTYNGGDATDCYGIVDGNDSTGTINAIGGLWGTGWDVLIRDTAPGGAADGTGTFQGISFTLTAEAGTSGNWTLTGTDTNGGSPLNLPTALDFVGVIKAGPNYGAYWFDNVSFDGSGGGRYVVRFGFNPQGIPPALSHLSLYIREGEDPDPGPDPVPEPTSLVLLGSGILLFAAVRRLRK